MKKFIVLLLTICGYVAYGKEPNEPGMAVNPGLRNTAPQPWQGAQEHSVHFFYDVDLGYAKISATGPIHFNDGNFMYGGNFGLRISMPSKSEATNQLSFAVGGYAADVSNFHMSTVRAPVSYTHYGYFGGSEDAGGLFWTLSVAPTYIFTATDKNAVDATAHTNRWFVEPLVFCGFHIPFVLVDRHSRREVGGGRVFVGPYFSYGFGNLSKDPGETINPGYKVGVRWSYMF